MTSEEAIARIKEHKIIHKMGEPRAIYISEALDMAIKALEQTRWIPVSEKLPEENTYVLTTTEWEDGSTDVCIDSIVNGKWVLSMLDDGDTVTAWMPLPEPYKAESEEVWI